MSAPTELLHKLQIVAGRKLWLINVPQAIAENISVGAELSMSMKRTPVTVCSSSYVRS